MKTFFNIKNTVVTAWVFTQFLLAFQLNATFDKPLLTQAFQHMAKNQIYKRLKSGSESATQIWDIKAALQGDDNPSEIAKDQWRLFVITDTVRLHSYLYCERLMQSGELEFWAADFVPMHKMADIHTFVRSEKAFAPIAGIIRHSSGREKKIFPQNLSNNVALQLIHIQDTDTIYQSCHISDEAAEELHSQILGELSHPPAMLLCSTKNAPAFNCESWIEQKLKQIEVDSKKLVFGLQDLLESL